MALIEYGPIPNLWGEPVRNQGPQMLMQAMMQDAQVQMKRHDILARTLKELDPIPFLSDINKLEQQKRIEAIEDMATDFVKGPKRGRLTQKDILELQFQIKNFQEWQARAQQGIQRLEKEMEIFNKAPEGFYKPEVFATGIQHHIETGEPPAGGFLQIAPKNFNEHAAQWKPFGEEGFTTLDQDKVFDAKKGDWIDKSKKVTRYGILNADGTAIDQEETRKAKEAGLMGLLLSDPQFMVDAEEKFARLQQENPTLAMQYAQKARGYEINAKAQQYQDTVDGKERGYPTAVNPAYLYAVDDAMKFVQPDEVLAEDKLEAATVQAQRMRDAQKKEEEKEVKRPSKYKDAGGDFLIKDVTDRNGFNSLVTIAKGDHKKRRVTDTGTEYYRASAMFSQVDPPKGRTYTVDENTTFVGMPMHSEEQWDTRFLGTNSRVWKEKVGDTFKVNSYSIHEGVPVYVGDKTIKVPAYIQQEDGTFVKASRGRSYIIAKNTPLTTAMEYSLEAEFGEDWDDEITGVGVDELDVAVMNVIGGQDEQTAQSSRMATVLDTKVKRELGIEDTQAQAEPRQEEEDLVALEDQTLILDGREIAFDALVDEIVRQKNVSREEAIEAIQAGYDDGRITVVK